MASTNKTTNYELSQFIETDRPAWLTDYNGDMRTIDSTMKAISDVASGASGSISELADRMSTAEGNITTNTNDIDALEARADSLEAQAQSTAGTIANIQTEQTAQNLGIEAATELGYNLARPYDSASTYAVGAYVLFQNTLYKCIAAVPVGEAFDPNKWLAIKATDEINAGGGATIANLDSTNFNLTISSVSGTLSNTSGSQAITISNTAFRSLSAYDNNFIAKIGNLNIIQFKIWADFDVVSVPANTILGIRINTNIPAIMGTTLLKSQSNIDCGEDIGTQSSNSYHSYLEISNNKLTFVYKIHNRSSSTINYQTATFIVTAIYPTS